LQPIPNVSKTQPSETLRCSVLPIPGAPFLLWSRFRFADGMLELVWQAIERKNIPTTPYDHIKDKQDRHSTQKRTLNDGQRLPGTGTPYLYQFNTNNIHDRHDAEDYELL